MDLLVRKVKKVKKEKVVIQVLLDQKVKKVKLDLKFRFSILLLQMDLLHIVLLAMVL